MSFSTLLHAQEHRWCENYDSDGKTAEIVTHNENFNVVAPSTFVMYILSGTVSLSYNDVTDYLLSEGDFMLFPPGASITGTVEGAAKSILLKTNGHISLCPRYSLEKLYDDHNMAVIEHTHLKSNGMVRRLMEGLAENIENGVRCTRFIEDKTQELFYILRFYYPKDELVKFYMPMLGTNAKFMNAIWKNYRGARNVEVLARNTNKSVSTLQKEFKRIVGESPGEWLLRQKIKNVHYDICQGEKSLKEIFMEYHFSSQSHLGTFCKKHYGKSPAELRQEKKAELPVGDFFEGQCS